MGTPAAAAARGRARRSEEYREARAEYAAIRELRERNRIAAHIRERRYELGLTQQDVAEQAGTAHSFVSKLESGNHIPKISVLQRILAVFDEELLLGVERQVPNEEPEREVWRVQPLVTARSARRDRSSPSDDLGNDESLALANQEVHAIRAQRAASTQQ